MKLLICNLKENKTLKEILLYKKMLESNPLTNIHLIICPSYPYLPIMHSKKYDLASQDVSEYQKGAYTGEVSAECLKSLDVKYVMIGHFEREMYFLENIEKQKKKIKNALKQNLKIILPIGETLMEHQLGKTKEVVLKKLSELLKEIPEEKKQNFIIAYEPIWRVGNNLPLNQKEIKEIIKAIKNWLEEQKFPSIPVVYGGGLNLENTKKLKGLDGLLLGNISLDREKMCQILINLQESTSVYKT